LQAFWIKRSTPLYVLPATLQVLVLWRYGGGLAGNAPAPRLQRAAAVQDKRMTRNSQALTVPKRKNLGDH
jgi:hypothetical protein